LLTLSGIGGMGKTRLALQLARRCLPQFSDGVWFADLAPVQAEGESPHHQFSLVSHLDLRHDLELDVQARYVGEQPAYAVKAYFTVDARLDWQVAKHLDLALVLVIIGYHLLV
jgi:predicted ATPase